MKRMYMQWLMLLILVLTTTAGFAADRHTGMGQGGMMNTGGYAGLGLGSAVFSSNEQAIRSGFSLPATATIDDNYMLFSMVAGVKLDKFLGLELGLPIIGRSQARDGVTKYSLFNSNGINVDAVGHYRYSNRLGFFAKLGAYMWMMNDVADAQLDDGLNLSYGLGADVDLYGGSERTFRFQWQRLNYNGIYVDSIDTFTAYLMFNFSGAR